MARYEHLPIFADAYRLAVLIEQVVGGFSEKRFATIHGTAQPNEFT